ncbi:YchJ family metal-binding protein [Microbacterium sp. G2-8]|uniref:YchJ family protein n=1 Tax=Microbacterium sp. G2-8 TaxID=2842454 RepID=UPI0027E31083|nr:YchJ family metal-binding protein [Microbacterium sp. G2-8]
MTTDACPCGSDLPYADCCGALHRGEREAQTPQELMRSRYAAFAKGDAFYLARTWHPRTRPDDLAPEKGIRWTSLEILDAGDDTVDFVASFEGPSGPGELREHSRFAQRAGRWVYVDGDVA